VTDYRVRRAEPGDAAPIAALLGELDYPAEPGAVEQRLGSLEAESDAAALVAVNREDVIGVVAYALFRPLERDGRQCRVTTLAVAPAHRRRGVAASLLAAVEEVARDRGCFRLEVTTRPDRAEALAFYERHGFEERPRRLVKPLAYPEPMDDEQVLSRIDELVQEEEQLLHRHESEGEGLSDAENARLQEIQVQLDRAWDYLRQRRALRQYGENPDDASERDADTVEHYEG
jgi:ribosomal protein S18 acetylase RimI-like enzyme